MQFCIRPGRVNWGIDISTKALQQLQKSGNKDQAISDAMSLWQKLADFFSDGAHAEAFGHVYDLVQARDSYLDKNSSETERTVLKKTAMRALDGLRTLAKPNDREKFTPEYDCETGQYFFDFSEEYGDFGFPLEYDPERGVTSDGAVVKDVMFFETFENEKLKKCWHSMHQCLDENVAVQAMSHLNAAYEATNVTDRISAFAKLSGLAKPASNDRFKIKIEDAFAHPASVSCIVGTDLLFKDSCLAGEEYTECLLDCPANLISNEVPTGSAAMMMYTLGKMNREKFNLIFGETDRAAAVEIMNDMCRNNESVTDENFGALYRLVDKRTTAIEDFLSVFLNDVSVKNVANACNILVTTLDSIPSRVEFEGGINGPANDLLTRDLNTVFGPGNPYPPIVKYAIRDMLYLSINTDVSKVRQNIKWEVLEEYFQAKS